MNQALGKNQDVQNSKLLNRLESKRTIKDNEQLKRDKIARTQSFLEIHDSQALVINNTTFDENKTKIPKKRLCEFSDANVLRYKYLHFFHSLIWLFWIPLRVAFEDSPNWYSVYMEAYFNIFFSIDIIRIFLSPYKMKNNYIEYSHKNIANNYLKGWLIFDLFCFFPLALIRYHHRDSPIEQDMAVNIRNLNFNEMPRIYKTMLVPQIIRSRFTHEYMKIIFDNIKVKVQFKNIIMTFLKFTLVLHISGCFYYAAAKFNQDGKIDWVRNLGI